MGLKLEASILFLFSATDRVSTRFPFRGYGWSEHARTGPQDQIQRQSIRCTSNCQQMAPGAGQTPVRLNIRMRLLAGISNVSANSKPAAAASFTTSPASRTPHSSFCERRLVSNTALLTAV